MRIARSVSPSSEDQQWLREQAGSAVVVKRLAERCRIVLLAVDGQSNVQIAATLGASPGRRRSGGAHDFWRRGGPVCRTMRRDADANRPMARRCRL